MRKHSSQNVLTNIAEANRCVYVCVCARCVLETCSRRLAVGESGNAAPVIIGSDGDSCTAKTTNSSSSPSYSFSQAPLIHAFLFFSRLLSFIVSPPPHLSVLISSCIMTILHYNSLLCFLSSSYIFADFFSRGSFFCCLPHTFFFPS